MLLAFSACGFPDVQYLETESDGGAGPGSSSVTGGGAGTAGAGGMTTSSSTGGAPPCSLTDANNSCGSGMKCTVLNAQTGEIGCGVAGPKRRWQQCNSDADCDVGLWCDLDYNVCKPWCVNANDCMFAPFDGQCIVAQDGNDNDIPGSPKHCIPDCDPKTASPCATNESVTCIHIGSNRFDCAESLNFIMDAQCTVSSDCGPGLLCVTIGMDPAACKLWCSPPEFFSPDCGLGECLGLQPMISWEGATMGTCL
jgi:hypothetical protein